MELMKCDVLANGPGPSERVVGIVTTNGKEEVVLHASALDTHNRLEVGVLGYDEKSGQALVELPRESVSGRWRVWVPRSALIQG
jgi:hypothetical protein